MASSVAHASMVSAPALRPTRLEPDSIWRPPPVDSDAGPGSNTRPPARQSQFRTTLAPCVPDENEGGDSDRRPSRRPTDQWRPAGADQPCGARLDIEEEPPDAEDRDPAGMDADRQPQTSAAQAGGGEQETEERQA